MSNSRLGRSSRRLLRSTWQSYVLEINQRGHDGIAEDIQRQQQNREVFHISKTDKSPS